MVDSWFEPESADDYVPPKPARPEPWCDGSLIEGYVAPITRDYDIGKDFRAASGRLIDADHDPEFAQNPLARLVRRAVINYLYLMECRAEALRGRTYTPIRVKR